MRTFRPLAVVAVVGALLMAAGPVSADTVVLREGLDA